MSREGLDLGFIGIGVMGSHMSRHLAAAGHRVAVCDANPKAARKQAETVAGITSCATPAEVAGAAEIVVLMLPDGRVVNEVATGSDGLVHGLRPGALVIDCSSSEPWLTLETATALGGAGAAMVDAPVSGAVEGARAADLVFMVGGSDSDFARARPVLEPMGRRIFHLGPLSSGHRMKTINNLATAITLAGTAEAMLIGRAAGLDPRAMLDVLNVSTGASFVTREKFGPYVLTGAYDDPFRLALMLKDVRIALGLAEEVGVETPLSDHAEKLYTEADASLGPGRSVLEYVRWREELGGVKLSE